MHTCYILTNDILLLFQCDFVLFRIFLQFEAVIADANFDLKLMENTREQFDTQSNILTSMFSKTSFYLLKLYFLTIMNLKPSGNPISIFIRGSLHIYIKCF